MLKFSRKTNILGCQANTEKEKQKTKRIARFAVKITENEKIAF